MYSTRLFPLRDRLIIPLLILLLALLTNPVIAQQFPVLEITGQAVPSFVEAGENVVVHLTVKNSGNAVAKNIQLTAFLPNAVIPIVNDIQPRLSSPPAPGIPLIWSFELLPVNETVPLTLPVKIDEAVLSGSLQIEVSYIIDGVTSEPTFISLAVQARPELSGTSSVEIVASEIIPSTVEVGGEAELQFTLKNSGGATANKIQIKVVLPAKINPVTTELADGEPIIWNFPELKAGQSEDIRLPIRIDSDAVPGEYKVEISNTINGIASIPKTIPLTVIERQGKPVIELSAERIISDKAEVGQEVTIQFTLKNRGDAPAHNAKIEVSLPVGVTPTKKGGQPVLADGDAAVWEFDELPADYVQSFILPVRVEDGAIIGKHTVQISYTSEDAGSGNVAVVLELIPQAVPVLKVLNQKISPEVIELGEKAIVQFTLKNSSDFIAHNIQLEAALPAGIVPVIEGSRPKFLLPSIGGVVVWELPEISGDKTVDFRLSVQVKPEVEINNNLTINIAYGTADALTLNLATPLPIRIISTPKDNEYSFVLFGGALTIALLIGVVAVIVAVAGLFLLKRRSSKKIPPVTIQTQQKQQLVMVQQETRQTVPTGFYLESVSRKVEPRYFALENISYDSFFIGRAMPADGINLSIDNSFPGWETVSRKHAMLYYDKNRGDIVIRDNKSQNGLYVDGFRTAHNLLKDGCVIKIGEVEFIYHQGEDGDTKPVGQFLGRGDKRGSDDE